MTAARRSSASASRTSTPFSAARPIATRIAVGVARPSAHGQATASTATAGKSAAAASRPAARCATKAPAATSSTAGTNTAETRSARRCAEACEDCASATSLAMRASVVSSPARSQATSSEPCRFTVPAKTRAPGVFSTGIGSPVSIDSSTLPAPLRTTPSTGSRSPGRTRTSSPGRTRAIGTSRSAPPSTRCAISGRRPSSRPSASCVRPFARSSRWRPSSAKATMTADVSKKRS